MKNFLQKLVFFRFIVLLMFISGQISAQKAITGRVTESATGNPLPGVTVVIKGTTIGTLADMDGKYQLNVDADGILVFSYVGMETQELNVGERTTINVVMNTVVETLDEVVVTGYGGTRVRSKLTNSISSVEKEILKTGVHANPAQALSGAVSGLKVTNFSGNPRAEPTIILRGGTDFNGTGSPLVIIDGQVGNMDDINPNDIKSIEVLKDAGATALYGARANNGVILITTKSGDVTEISLNVKYGFDYLNNQYEFFGAEEYLYWIRTGIYNASRMYQATDGNWQGYNNATSLSTAQPFGTGNRYFDSDGVTPLDGQKNSLAYWSPMFYTPDLAFLLNEGWKKMTDPVTGKEIIYTEFDRKKAGFNDPAVTQDYNVSFSGGNDRGKYYAGLGSYDAEGLPVKTWYKRLNFTLNGEYMIRKWLTSKSNFLFTDAKWFDSPTSSEGNYFGRVLSAPPTLREFNINGEYLPGGNPLYDIPKLIRESNSNKFHLGQSFKISFLNNLSLELSGKWLYDREYFERFDKDRLTGPGRMSTSRYSEARYTKTLSNTYNAILNYSLTKNQHSADALLGYEFYDSQYTYLSASGKGAPTDDFRALELTTTEEGARVINSNHSQERIRSYFGRINYDYNEKYLMSITFRRDGYSRLLGDNRWGFFPGVSAGWIINKERFMERYRNIISFLKLRSSYGLNGNVSGIGTYELQGSYVNILYNGSVGYQVGSIPNPGLKWERSKTAEFGIDISFFENKINSNFTYYNRLTLDKYANIPLPVSSGINSIRSNNGKFRNKGVEIELSFKALRKPNLSWDIAGNISYNKNIVVKLPDNGLERNRQGAFQVYDEKNGELIWVDGYQEGQTPGDLYVYEALGIYKDWDEVKALANNLVDKGIGSYGSNNRPLYGPQAWADLGDNKGNGLPIKPGDVIWRDVNGDGLIDAFDKVKVGNTQPKWFGGLTSTLAYKGFQLYARMDYSFGFKQLDWQRPWFMGFAQGTFNTLVETRDTWTADNPNAQYPEYRWADQLGSRNVTRPTSMFVYDGSYLAFRELSLSYSLPKPILENMAINEVTFSITGQNIGYFTASKMNRPEIYGSDYLESGYSMPRKLILGLNVKF